MNKTFSQEIEDEFSGYSADIDLQNEYTFRQGATLLRHDGAIYKKKGESRYGVKKIRKQDEYSPWRMTNGGSVKGFIQDISQGESFENSLSNRNITESKGVSVLRNILKECQKKRISHNIDLQYIAPNGLGKTKILSPKKSPNAKLDSNTIYHIKNESGTLLSISQKYATSPSNVLIIKHGLTWSDGNKSLGSFPEYLTGEDNCKDYIKKYIYPNGYSCRHCGCEKVYITSLGFRCLPIGKGGCNRKFTLTSNTSFNKSLLPIDKIVHSIFLFHSNNSISSIELAKKIAVTQKTSWGILKKIKTANARNQPLNSLIKKLLTPSKQKKV